jgi:hypothetical protein
MVEQQQQEQEQIMSDQQQQDYRELQKNVLLEEYVDACKTEEI